MSRGAQLTAHILATAAGLLMVAIVGIGSHGPTLVAATSAVVLDGLLARGVSRSRRRVASVQSASV